MCWGDLTPGIVFSPFGCKGLIPQQWQGCILADNTTYISWLTYLHLWVLCPVKKPKAPSSGAHCSRVAPPTSGCSHDFGISCSNAESDLILASAGSLTLPSTKITQHTAIWNSVMIIQPDINYKFSSAKEQLLPHTPHSPNWDLRF